MGRKAQTQVKRLEDYLKDHGNIGPIEAWKNLGIYRLSARIFELRKITSLNINTKREVVKNTFDEPIYVARYVNEVKDV
jgi:hypothetical protein